MSPWPLRFKPESIRQPGGARARVADPPRSAADREEDRRARPGRTRHTGVVIGVVAFAIAIAIITIAFGSGIGWSPSQYNIEINNL